MQPAYIAALVGLVVGIAGTVWSLLSLRATRRAEMWRRFQWAVEAVTTKDNEPRTEVGWALLSEVIINKWTPKGDARMMNTMQNTLMRKQQEQPRGLRRRGQR